MIDMTFSGLTPDQARRMQAYGVVVRMPATTEKERAAKRKAFRKLLSDMDLPVHLRSSRHAKPIPVELLAALYLSADSKTGLRWCSFRAANAQAGSVAGTIRRDGRPIVAYMGKFYLAYRIIETMLNGVIPEDHEVDHRNRTPSDSSADNLQRATRSQNMANTGKRARKNGSDMTSPFKGVSWHVGKWVAAIDMEGSSLYLGRFADECDAADAYDSAALQFHGDFAKTNRELVPNYRAKRDAALASAAEATGNKRVCSSCSDARVADVRNGRTVVR